MIRRESLNRAAEALARQFLQEAKQEAEVLLRSVLGVGRAELYTDMEYPLSPRQARAFQEKVERRLSYEPAAYILGQREFFGLEFYVDNRVLIPRPESELLVETAIDLASRFYEGKRPLLVADIGTGSGALAIALAVSLPQAFLYATDISSSALESAAINCRRHGVSSRVCLLQGDLLEPLSEAVDIIVANLPYVSRREWEQLSPEVKLFEPPEALLGGEDGLDLVRRLLYQASGKLLPGGSLLLEIGMGQGGEVSELAKHYFPRSKVELLPDLAGIERVVSIAPQLPRCVEGLTIKPLMVSLPGVEEDGPSTSSG